MSISTAAVIAGIVVVILTIVTMGVVALKILAALQKTADVFTRAHSDTLGTLERVHDRNLKHIGEAMDRVMAMDFSQFKSYQGTEALEGGFEPPEEPAVRIERPRPDGRWGLVGGARAASVAAALEEEQILREDFPPEENL